MEKYVQLLCQEIADLEGKVFEIKGLKVTFKFEEVPNDMKMLAMLGGELSNSAKFFPYLQMYQKKVKSDHNSKFSNLSNWKEEA